MPKSYAPQVIADSSGKWAGNALRFPTREEAEANVKDLEARWMMVRDTRVIESDDEPNYRWIDGKLVRIGAGS
jgi:hypothetical protein